MGQGKDYVYHGTNVFKGIHKGDILGLSDKQKEAYNKTKVHEIHPEYWVIKTGKFSGRVKDKLDEWVYFLKNSEIKPTFSARGLKAASEKLDEMKLPEKERAAYNAYIKHLMSISSRNHTIEIDAKEMIKKAKEEAKEEATEEFILEMHKEGLTIAQIAKISKKPENEVRQIIEKHTNK